MTVARSRNAAATKAEILAAARSAFANHGYEQVGMREIAAAVGVNAALVVRYFGSKEALFKAAVTEGFSMSGLIGERSEFGMTLARYILSKRERGQLEPTLALIRSASNPQAAALMRELLDEQFIKPLARWLGGRNAEVRAGLIAAQILGLALAREVIESKSLNKVKLETLVQQSGAVLQRLADNH